MRLRGSVGLGGRNWKPDVIRIQRLLDQAGVSPGPPDGRCGRLTMQAIERFQQHFMRKPDGRVDVNGPTFRKLQSPVAQAAAPRSPQPQPSPTAPKRNSPHPATAASPPLQTRRKPAHTPLQAPTLITPQNRKAPGYWATRTPLPSPGAVNRGLTCPTSQQMEALFGDPHEKRVKDRLITGSVGPMRVTGHRAALESLSTMFAKVKRDLPDLYGLIASWGMYNLRNIRGKNCYSNHSWGTAIDLIVDGLAIHLGETQSCKGVDALVPYFNEAGWYWGGGYRKRKDCMHFECGLQLARSFGR